MAHTHFEPYEGASDEVLELRAERDRLRELCVRLMGADEWPPEAPQPMNQDERGGCVWCGGTSPRSWYAGSNARDHMPDCPWVEARDLLFTSR